MTTSDVAPAAAQLPITAGPDGQPQIPAKEVSRLLRAIALVSIQPIAPHNLVDLSILLMAEADHLDARAIAHTTETP